MTFWLLWFWLGSINVGPVADSCTGCHAEQAAEHATSRHRVAFDNPLFQHEYAAKPKAWCVTCHAPEVPAALRTAPPIELTKRGVSCISCHLRDGHMTSRTRSATSIHQTRSDPDFGGAAMCGSCHQFNFPELDESTGVLHRYTDEPMQNTVAEYRATNVDVSCSGCHSTDGHQFSGSHDRATLRDALAVSVCRSGASVRVDIANRGAAHNVPSGGVHRHIAFRAWRSSAPAELQSTLFGRTFGGDELDLKKLTSDTTLRAGQRRRLFIKSAALGGTSEEPINLRLDYVFQAPDAEYGEAPEPPLSFWERRFELARLEACR